MNFNILHGNKNNLPLQKKAGQIYITDDSLEVFYDLDNANRYNLGNVYSVDLLPDTPIPNKIYFLKPDKLYTYDNEWKCLNDTTSVLSTFEYAQQSGYTGTEEQFKSAFVNSLKYQLGVGEVNGVKCVTLTYDDGL